MNIEDNNDVLRALKNLVIHPIVVIVTHTFSMKSNWTFVQEVWCSEKTLLIKEKEKIFERQT